jgi:hypothetical protein
MARSRRPAHRAALTTVRRTDPGVRRPARSPALPINLPGGRVTGPRFVL